MIGYHVTIVNKSFQKTIKIAYEKSDIKSFQLFCRNPRSSRNVKYNLEEADKCKQYIEDNSLFLVTHGGYIINTSNNENFDEKVDSIMNEMIYSEKIGAIGTVYHVGKYVKLEPEIAIENMYNFISKVIDKLQEENSKLYYILETSSNSGTELLSNIEDLGNFYERFSNKQKENFKICLDTCHVFSAGYQIDDKEECKNFINLVEKSIGWNNICVVHLNDCKKKCGCCADRHENIGKGFISKESFEGMKLLINHCLKKNIPMILETPHDEYNIYDIHNKELKYIYDRI